MALRVQLWNMSYIVSIQAMFCAVCGTSLKGCGRSNEGCGRKSESCRNVVINEYARSKTLHVVNAHVRRRLVTTPGDFVSPSQVTSTALAFLSGNTSTCLQSNVNLENIFE